MLDFYFVLSTTTLYLTCHIFDGVDLNVTNTNVVSSELSDISGRHQSAEALLVHLLLSKVIKQYLTWCGCTNGSLTVHHPVVSTILRWHPVVLRWLAHEELIWL